MRERRVRRRVSRLDRGHLAGGRADPQPADEGLYGLAVAARQHFHAAIRQVAGVPMNAQLLRAARGCGTVEDTLDTPGYHALLANHAQLASPNDTISNIT